MVNWARIASVYCLSVVATNAADIDVSPLCVPVFSFTSVRAHTADTSTIRLYPDLNALSTGETKIGDTKKHNHLFTALGHFVTPLDPQTAPHAAQQDTTKHNEIQLQTQPFTDEKRMLGRFSDGRSDETCIM